MPPPNSDDVLLARLNALKKSSVTLSTHPPSAAEEITPDALRDLGLDDKQPAGEDDGDPILDLAARFKRLNGGKTSPATVGITAESSSTEVGEEGKSLDELLKELGSEREDWEVSRKEETDVSKLVREVRSVLPDVAEPRRDDGKGERGHVEGGDEENVDQDALDEQEADEYIAQVLAELDLETKHSDGNEEGEGVGRAGEQAVDESSPAKAATISWEQAETQQNGGTESSLALPAAPTSLPTPPPAPKDDFDKATAVDDALTARFEALSRGSPSPGLDGATGLPSAPSFAPSIKPPVKASNFTDEEIDSWCIICYADATVRCLGCDGDLYCQGCWNEGHRGESAGYEERMHRAVQFVKGGGSKKVPVGAG